MIAFYLPGQIPVYSYSLLLSLGLVLGAAWSMRQGPRLSKALTPLDLLDASLWTAAGGLLGGRLLYVLADWPYFRLHPRQSYQIFLGGLSWPGALAGGLLALTGFALLTRRPLGELAGRLLPLGACLAIAAWLACWVDGCAYGPAANGLWGLPARDAWGTISLRWPLQFLGALTTLGGFWILDRRVLPARPGRAALLGLLGLALELLALALLRLDPAPAWHSLPLDAWAALGFIALAAAGFLASLLQAKRSTRRTL